MSSHDFHANKRERSLDMIERVKYMAQKGEPELARSIWEKTMKEVKSGTMGPPLTLEQVHEQYDGDFQVTPSFGLAQGLDEHGNRKFRRIDDHTASGVNPSAHRLQKVPMAMVDYVGVMMRAVAAICPDVQIATEDMKGAYRQIPLAPADVRYAITAVYSPECKDVVLFEMYGQPFGAGHAVPNFCRVSEWLSRFLQRFFSLHVDHFFDDFFLIEPSRTIQAGIFVMKESFKILGFSLDPEKSQPPAEVGAVLGVFFSTAALASERRIHVAAKPSRVRNLTQTIDQILNSGELSPAVAASIVGKFGFLCSTLFGKVGRCCTAALRHRQYSTAYQRSITPALHVSLQLMKQFLVSCPDRELKLSHERPLLMYTDASDVPGRFPQRLLGAVLFDPIDKSLVFSSWPVADAIVSRWLQKESYMGQLELLAAPFAFSTWQDRIQNRSLILFIDNDSAAASPVKGYSPKVDSGAIVGEFWLLAAQLRVHVYIDRVESKSNLADGPSRNQFDEIKGLGGSWTSPRTGAFGEPISSLPSWFGTPSQRGERTWPRATPSGGRSGGGLFSQWDGSSSILTLSLRMGLSRERFRAKEPKRVVPVPIPMPSDLWGRKICSRVASIFARFAEGNTCKCAENGRNVAILGQASLGQPPPRSSFVSHLPTRGKKWRGSLLSVRWFQLDTHPELTHGAQQGEI